VRPAAGTYAQLVTSPATRRLVTAVIATPLLLAQLLTGCSARSTDGTTRVLLFGDSITHGKDGDWTWRYRLWRQLQDEGERDVDFVGPADDLYSGSNAYQDPLFDHDHAARWGTTLAAPAYSPADLGRDYAPDVVVIELGVNDLRHGASPTEVEASMRGTVGVLRAEDPGVDVVLVHVPVLTVEGAAELNSRYDAIADELDTDDERVVVATADRGFLPDPLLPGSDSYDGLHPGPSGEVKIAASVGAALAQLGIGLPA
jgi:lysophospholipase L1-like esterase